MIWIIAYLASVIGVNVAFAHAPQYAAFWSLAVGFVFVARDFAQRRVGHHILWFMVAGIVASYFLASPFVALASASAFAVSESADWLVFTITKRPLRDRVLGSCLVAAPLDSAVFLTIIGAFAMEPFAAQIASKIAAAFIVYMALHIPRLARAA